jgi:hypothetical protein
MTPSSFSHPLLVAQRVAPTTEPQADAPRAPKSDKASDAGISAISTASLELRSTIGHGDGAKRVLGEPLTPTSLREQTHTADAGSNMPAAATMNDATPSGNGASAREDAATPTDSTPSTAENAASTRPAETSKPDAKPAENVSTDDKPAETAASEVAGNKPDEAQPAVQAGGDTENAATGATSEKPDDTARAVTDVGAGEAKKDQARLPDIARPAAAKSDPAAAAPKRSGQIAVLISRKDQKLYVRQNFSPLFEVPVAVAPSDRPLGTHVFTAQIDKADANIVHWSVVSLPAPRRMARHGEDERVSRKRKMAAVVEIKELPAPDSPAEALDRLTIPAGVMARIAEALSTGGSIIVSDQGINQGETGEGTDFIVSLR